MNKYYIAGFFDADGYITLAKKNSNQNPTVTVGFTNCVRPILERIQKHLLTELSVKGTISKKTAREENHNDSYDLKYVGLVKSIQVLSYLPITHPKKSKRLKVAIQIKQLTSRNGKYDLKTMEKRNKLCVQFLRVE